MDRTPSRRLRCRSPEQAAPLTTPARLSSGRRRSLSVLSPDVETSPVSEKKQRINNGTSDTNAVPHFSTLLDGVADSVYPCPAQASTLGSVLIVRVEKDGVDFVFNQKLYRVADLLTLESLLAQRPGHPLPSQTVASVRAAQRAKSSLALRKFGLAPIIPLTSTDAGVARSSFDEALKFAKEFSKPEACPRTELDGMTGPSPSRLLVTRVGEDRVEFVFEGSAYRATDPLTIQALASEQSVHEVQRTVSSLRTAQRVACLSRETAAPWLWAPPVLQKTDAEVATSNLKCAWSFANVLPVCGNNQQASVADSSVLPSAKRLPSPLLILTIDGDAVEFVCDGSVYKTSDSAALREVLAKSHRPPSACSLSSLRATQRIACGQHTRPSQQSMPVSKQPSSDADVASGCLARALSFVKSIDAFDFANRIDVESNKTGPGKSFDPKSGTSGALLCTHADAERTEFFFEGNVYRVREKAALEASLARPGCSQAKRSVSSILAAQRAARKASAKQSFLAQSSHMATQGDRDVAVVAQTAGTSL